jgi:hypothetical protein
MKSVVESCVKMGVKVLEGLGSMVDRYIIHQGWYW